ncbi:hypothetical protein SCUCBS95973_003797 [Sporothrix curviconia]|uniref:Pathway-specific nitrogen regulator n=1 Tax=Sporothrix curviconia TaxID=1260050 RepID=A0ABP0BIE4_9PEZI
MADDILLEPTTAAHQEASPEETILDRPALEAEAGETQSALLEGEVYYTDEAEDSKTGPEAELDGDSHGVANVVAAIDAFLAEPSGMGDECQTESQDEHDDSHSEADKAELSLMEDANDADGCHPEAHSEAMEHDNEFREEATAPSPAATADGVSPEKASEPATVEAEVDQDEPHTEEEEANSSHISEEVAVPQRESSHELDDQLPEHFLEEEHSSHLAEEEHGEHSLVENYEADISVADSEAPPHATDLEAAHGDAEVEGNSHYEVNEENYEEEPAEKSIEDTSRRGSASSSRSGGSTRRTSLRTEALIQAAARAVVAKINEKNATDDDFDIMRAMSESHENTQNEDADDHHHQQTTTYEDGEIDNERDVDYDDDDDDVFSDRSPRSSLGSFEHNSGASNNGAGDEQQKKNFAEADTANHNESEDEHDYVDETGSVAYHGRHSQNGGHRSPRLSTVSGISHMSQYEQHEDHDEEEYDDDENFVPHTIRGTPRPAFRTPSSVRAIQMSSPSPSVIFGVSPRSAARRRRLGTGSGPDDGQSMGSVGTYSSLPSSLSKNLTPTRFKVFRKPEPAPLVLLHATLMPTRWAWSDVLRTLDERLSSANKSGIRDDLASPASENMAAFSFEPSAALKRLHGAWCQLQEYSIGADTVAERGVLLPHPQNDYEVLEERLLEALELPVRRRARILECGHYLGPADEDDDEFDDDDDDYYNDRPSYRDDSDSPNKRHWCTTCRSDIRYESLGAERVFRVKVYASNGLMTVGAWAACWSEMERVDVEIEPIVADAALLRELNQLRTLQQQEAIQKQEEEEVAAAAAATAAAAAAEAEFEVDNHDMHHDHDDHDEELMEHTDHEETLHSPAAVDHFHLAPHTAILASSPLCDPPLEPPAITTTDRASGAERRQREAEERLREIYGRTPPQAALSAAPTSQSHRTETARLSDVPETVETASIRDIHGEHSPYGPSPPSPSAEAFERREERRSRQFQPSDRGIHNDAAGQHAASAASSVYSQHPQTPYDSASLPELLVAAGRVFMRDRKHVAIMVLSIIAIVLATLRSPGAGGADVTAVSGVAVGSVQSQVPDSHPVIDHRLQRDGGIEVAQKGADMMAGSVMDEIVKRVASTETLVETVVEKMTVKVYETVTETSTETSTSIETSTASTTEAATTATATLNVSATEMVEAASVKAFKPIEPAEEQPSVSTATPSLSANDEAGLLFATTCASVFGAEPSIVDEDSSAHNKL